MQVIFWDIDGTLLASGGAGKAAMDAAMLEAFGLGTLDDRVKYAGRTDRDIARELFARNDVPFTPETWQRFIGTYLRLLPLSLHERAGHILPGVTEALWHLSERPDIALGLITGNLRAGAEIKLRHFGLWHHFRFGGFGDVVFDRNEVALAGVTEARQIVAEYHPERVWVLGDTPLDIACARAIGAKVIATATGQHSVAELAEHQPDVVVPDLRDTAALLRLWGLTE
jgi:phosphoglycolate phosphatase-like HAD superfamily hydrolase